MADQQTLPPAELFRPVRVVPKPSGLSRWRASWSGRHTIATIAALPLLFLAYRSAAGELAASPPLVAVLALEALLGAFVVASYVPLVGTRFRFSSFASPCGATPILFVAGLPFLIASTPLQASNLGLAMFFVMVSVGQRFFGSSACA